MGPQKRRKGFLHLSPGTPSLSQAPPTALEFDPEVGTSHHFHRKATEIDWVSLELPTHTPLFFEPQMLRLDRRRQRPSDTPTEFKRLLWFGPRFFPAALHQRRDVRSCQASSKWASETWKTWTCPGSGPEQPLLVPERRGFGCTEG